MNMLSKRVLLFLSLIMLRAGAVTIRIRLRLWFSKQLRRSFISTALPFIILQMLLTTHTRLVITAQTMHIFTYWIGIILFEDVSAHVSALIGRFVFIFLLFEPCLPGNVDYRLILVNLRKLLLAAPLHLVLDCEAKRRRFPFDMVHLGNWMPAVSSLKAEEVESRVDYIYVMQVFIDFSWRFTVCLCRAIWNLG